MMASMLPSRVQSGAAVRPASGRSLVVVCPVQRGPCPATEVDATAASSRRALMAGLVFSTGTVLMGQPQPAAAISYGADYKKELARRRRKIPEEDFKDGPDGLKYYDVVDGDGPEAKLGQRIAVHYDVKYRNVTFITSRQGLGVTGGNPVGFDVGAPSGTAGSTLPGIDLGVRGMRVGGIRRLIVPSNLAYGNVGVGEIPPGATLNIDVELLSIKTNPLGYRTKLVEG